MIGSKIRESKILSCNCFAEGRVHVLRRIAPLECRGISYRGEFNNAVRIVRIETSLRNEWKRERGREKEEERNPDLLAGLSWIWRAAARHLSLDSLITMNQSRRESFIREPV